MNPDLCTYCRIRVAGFIERHPHLEPADIDRHAADLARACCSVWAGREPDHWTGGRWIR